MNLSPREKLVYLGLIPLFAAGIGSTATYLATQNPPTQVVLTSRALEKAEAGKITVEVVNREEGDPIWPLILLPLTVMSGFAIIIYAATRN